MSQSTFEELSRTYLYLSENLEALLDAAQTSEQFKSIMSAYLQARDTCLRMTADILGSHDDEVKDLTAKLASANGKIKQQQIKLQTIDSIVGVLVDITAIIASVAKIAGI